MNKMFHRHHYLTKSSRAAHDRAIARLTKRTEQKEQTEEALQGTGTLDKEYNEKITQALGNMTIRKPTIVRPNKKKERLITLKI